ncbi:hypothetical protein HY229_09525 [Candidatus Acetothermia bacterium]|nr:hypothetical protein [Candidatus Acetothermia bacterium]MBI3644323.1 hypothetical protein [Candidatus Acetothermia bacterium]
MRHKVFAMTMLVMIVAAVAGCATLSPILLRPASVESDLTYSAFITQLRETGAKVIEPIDDIHQPFFSVIGTVILADDEYIQVFKFDDPEAAEEATYAITPDGDSADGFQWAAHPHCFMKGSLIVLYGGTNQTLLSDLRQILGLQFAGK